MNYKRKGEIKMNICDRPKQWFYDLIDDKNIPEARGGFIFQYLVIVPTEERHDSGFNIMYFILFDKESNPIAKATYGADIFKPTSFLTDTLIKNGNIEPPDIGIDLLPCGLFRLFYYQSIGTVCFNMSEFETAEGFNKDKMHCFEKIYKKYIGADNMDEEKDNE